MTEREITLSEIRQCDTIRVETLQQDLEVSLTGTAHSLDPFTNDWLTKAGLNLTTRSRPQKYVLLDRPKTPLPTVEGSIIYVVKARNEFGKTAEYNRFAVLDFDGEWGIVTRGGTEYFSPEDVHEWNPVTLTIEEAK